MRIQDNLILNEALVQAKSAGGLSASNQLLCVYCFDPRQCGPEAISPFKSHKTGSFRSNFLLESAANLRENLRSLGNELHVYYERPEVILPQLARQVNTPGSKLSIFCQKEPMSEEKLVEEEVRKSVAGLAEVIAVEGNQNLYHPSEVRKVFKRDNYADLMDTFTPVKEKLERNCRVSSLLPIVHTLPPAPAVLPINSQGVGYMPSISELGFDASSCVPDPRGVMRFDGGESAAMNRIKTWIFEEDNLKEYFDIRNGMLGQRYSSKLSPYLAYGCISPRQIYHAVKDYEASKHISNKSTYWLIFELIWRDFYFFLGSKYGNDLFKLGGAHRVTSKTWSRDEEVIQRWKTGMTGQPLVDANMRELLATGWMSNRGRQIVASYLVLDLNIDWRIGADHFESLLLDHDVTSNYGNWNAAAGLTGGRVNRFNIVKQSKDYDPAGEYIKHWIPELKHVPVPILFEPWLLSAEDRKRYKAEAYPLPIDIPASRSFYQAAPKPGVAPRAASEPKADSKSKRKNRVQHL
jgi:deoxyribodipyrimidine photo-lyase